MKSQVMRISAVLLMGAMLVLSGGCKKDRTYKAKVIVKYASDQTPAAFAYVETGCPVCVDDGTANGPVQGPLTTDANGEVLLEFRAKMVLDVTALKGNLSGAGFLQLEEGETIVEEILIQ